MITVIFRKVRIKREVKKFQSFIKYRQVYWEEDENKDFSIFLILTMSYNMINIENENFMSYTYV